MTQIDVSHPRPEPQPPRPPGPGSTSPPGGWWWVAATVGLAGAVVMMLVGIVIAIAGQPGRGATGGQPISATPAVASAVAPAPPAFEGSLVPVTIREFQVVLPSVMLRAGHKTLSITNAGAMQHELLVFHPDASIDPNHLPLGPDGNINEDAPGVNKISDGDNIDPGKSQTRQIDLSAPGTYIFVCNLPGHYKMGMWTKVTVVAAPTAEATLREFKVGVPTSLAAGKYNFTIDNAGVMQHELLVFHPDGSIDPGQLPLGPDGNINEDAPGVNKISDGDNIDPGKSQTREVDLSKPGTYVFVCNLPGHYKMGMSTVVTVR